MAALDRYNTASNISLLRQAMDYGHIYDLQKLMPKVLLNTQYLAAMNPTSGSFVINPRLQRRFATLAVSFPSAEALNSIYSTFLLGTRLSMALFGRIESPSRHRSCKREKRLLDFTGCCSISAR